jgi:hypothetical protein
MECKQIKGHRVIKIENRSNEHQIEIIVLSMTDSSSNIDLRTVTE